MKRMAAVADIFAPSFQKSAIEKLKAGILTALRS